MNLLNLLTVNSRQWQESSDEWVKAMHKSRKKKEAKRLLVCDHGDLEWCEVCQYDENGEKYEI
jgi:hypothetical protein